MANVHRFFNPDGSLAATLTGAESFGEMLAIDARPLIVCRPLVANVPEGRDGWEQAACPQCEARCWITDNEPRPLPARVTALCTRCALLATGAFKEKPRP